MRCATYQTYLTDEDVRVLGFLFLLIDRLELQREVKIYFHYLEKEQVKSRRLVLVWVEAP